MHAGLEKGKAVEEQLEFLKARDTRVPKVEALSGRKSVWDIPEVTIFLVLVGFVLLFCVSKKKRGFLGKPLFRISRDTVFGVSRTVNAEKWK